MVFLHFVASFALFMKFLWTSASLIILLVVTPACFGAELGVRRLYIRLLMKAFKWGTAKIKSKKPIISGGSEEIISKENSINDLGNFNSEQHKKFELGDIMYLIKSGIEAVIDDEVTKRFRAEELPSWNLLTRTNFQYQFISIRLSFLWFAGLIFRYMILLPMRVFITFFALCWIICTMLPLTFMEDTSLKRKLAYYVNVVGFRIICRGFSAVVTYHDRENMPKPGGICVANHTTTLDAAILMQDRPYAILGQIHGGFLGSVMRIMSRATKHVWFERSEVRDRKFVSERIMKHVSDLNNSPVLLFPEGTCINNTSVMMFKKGSFEIPTTIYPVAIKYNPWFGDAFWNSSKHSMLQYLLVVMTSWAIVADVWYLPAMDKEPSENAMQFAERVKAVIARKGGLVDCLWDGQLKRMKVKDSYLQEKQKELGEIYAKSKEEDKLHKNPVKKVRFDISNLEHDSSSSEEEQNSEDNFDENAEIYNYPGDNFEYQSQSTSTGLRVEQDQESAQKIEQTEDFNKNSQDLLDLIKSNGAIDQVL
ncbi:glycerol-3-phosphate acyltransferase 3-like isoform X2 [Clavelina lepadiformis]|uniref:glycerol-3-phosphate acyltransferase 3-like isoform X2 n=1 Tax=Clavelina lepadiformis TaxID=159417 RepID=UPI004042E2FF